MVSQAGMERYMSTLVPMDVLYEQAQGTSLPLTPALAAIYGSLHIAKMAATPIVLGNFVATLDGVVSFNTPGKPSGGDISGFNQHDRLVMGILRAVADAVVVGAGTLRGLPRHVWTAQQIYPPFAHEYERLRSTLGKTKPPLNVLITASGDLDPTMRIFQERTIPVLIVTTTQGKDNLADRALPPHIRITSATDASQISAHTILEEINRIQPCDLVLVEGGPQLMGAFFGEGRLDELFLTIAPQVAGRDASVERPGFVAGRLLAPAHPMWGNLISIRRAGSHLFVRYAFERHELSAGSYPGVSSSSGEMS